MPYHCDLASEWSKSGVALAAQREQSFTALAYGDLIDVERITAPPSWVGRRRQPGQSGDAGDPAERIRGAELLAYHGVGHTPRWEVPTRFAGDVAAFVVRLMRPRR